MGMTVLLCLLFYRHSLYLKKNTQDFTHIGALWLIWIFITGASLWSTISIPLTLNKFIFSLFSFVFFTFLLHLDKKWMSWEVMKLGYIILGFNLTLLSLFVSLMAGVGSYLPSMGLLVANFGHNHVAVYVLFALPLVWEQWEKHQGKKTWTLVFFYFLCMLIMSFGRVALFLGILEIALLWWKRRAFLSAQMKKIGYAFFIMMVSSFFIFLTLSISATFLKDHYCFTPQFKIQLCKEIKREPRLAYWQQSISAWKNKPILGWGGGTFELLSLRFREGSYEYSSFAHNEYLQTIAEYGLVGGIFLSIFCFLIIRRISKVLSQGQEKYAPTFFIAIGVLILMIDAFFDYNFQFSSIWLLFLTGLAFFFSETSPERKRGHHFIFSHSLIRVASLLSSVLILGWIGLYLGSTLLWNSHNYELSLRVFPFVQGRVEEKIGSSEVSDTTAAALYDLYKNHSPIVRSYLQRIPSQNQYRYLQKLLEMDRIRYLFVFLKKCTEEGRWDEFNKAVKSIDDAQVIDFIPQQQLEVIGRFTIEGANTAFLQGKYLLAQDLYSHVYRLNPSFFGKSDAFILSHPESAAALADISYIDTWDTNNLGSYWQSLSLWYSKRMEKAIEQRDWPELQLSVSKLLVLHGNSPDFLWPQVSSLMHTRAQAALAHQDIAQMDEYLWQWRNVYVTLADVSPHLTDAAGYTCLFEEDFSQLKSLAAKTQLTHPLRTTEDIIGLDNCPGH